MSVRSKPAHPALLRELAKYEQVCRQNPNNFQGWRNLGRTHAALGQQQQALAAFDRALLVKPQHLDIILDKLKLCLQSRQLETALQMATQALALSHNNAEALLYQGHALLQLEQNRAALLSYDRLLVLKPVREQRLSALAGKTLALDRLGDYETAMATVAQGLQLSPTAPDWLLNRASLAIRMHRYEDALHALDALSAPHAQSFSALGNRAQALAALGRFDDCEAVLTVLRAQFPRELRAREFSGTALQIPTDAVAMGYTPQSLYFNTLFDELAECDWQRYPELIEALEKLTRQAEAGEPVPLLEPFRLMAVPSSKTLRLAVARARSAHIEQALAPLREKLHFDHPQFTVERLRIGYVSGDFRDHATAHLLRKLFQVHDRSRFEVFGYSLLPGDGSVYWQDISCSCDRFTVVHDLSNAAVAEKIQRDGVHILVDLHGYTRHARPEIFALRPAPVQVGYLGYPGSMGAAWLPYLIADRCVLPEEHQPFYSEQPVWLPDCYQINDDESVIAEGSVSRAEQGLPEDAFVYCCFNTHHKIDPASFVAWMRILAQVPGSVLWLLGNNERVERNLRQAAQAQGINPERLVFARRLPKAQHLARHRLADLFLDTFIYGAHTTASDALWAGLPVLTLRGDTFPARVGASLLQALKLPELIVGDTESFVTAAVNLATEQQRLAALKALLVANRANSTLFDTVRFARQLETVFCELWTKRCSEQV